MDVIVYAGNVYVGGQNEARQGVLLGPAVPAATSEPVSAQTLSTPTASLSPQPLQNTLQQLDQVIADPASTPKATPKMCSPRRCYPSP